MYIHFIGSLKLSEIQTKPSELQITQIFLKLCTKVSLSFDSFQTVALRVMKRCICMPKGKKPRWNNKRAMNISAVCWVSIFFRFFSSLTKASFTFTFFPAFLQWVTISVDSLILFAQQRETLYHVCFHWGVYLLSLRPSFFSPLNWMDCVCMLCFDSIWNAFCRAKTNRMRITLMLAFFFVIRRAV